MTVREFSLFVIRGAVPDALEELLLRNRDVLELKARRITSDAWLDPKFAKQVLAIT